MAVDFTRVNGQNPAYGRPVCLLRYSRYMGITVRRAEPFDARSVAEIHVQCWQEAFAHLVPAENLARLNVDQRERRWSEILSFPGANIWLALDGKKIVGFAGSSENREPDLPVDRELQALYVLASHLDTEAEQLLLGTVIGDSSAVLWIADKSPRVLTFYIRNGFKADGTTKTGPIAGTDVLQRRMVRGAAK